MRSPVTEVATLLVSVGASFAVALGTLWVANRSGYTDLQHKLMAALKERVAVLEAENAQLRNEVAMLERRYERLEADYEALKSRMDHA